MDRDGIGMTSMRTRQRLVQRLAEQGITSTEVLEAVRSTPRHLFVDEALAHRAYEVRPARLAQLVDSRGSDTGPGRSSRSDGPV